MSTKRRVLREEKSFSDSAGKLGGSKRVDAALEAILDALTLRPEGFDLVPGWGSIRIAKTVTATQAGEEVPAVRLWFTIVDENVVSLLYVEKIEDDI